MPGFLPDTSVLVAAVCSWHEHHQRAIDEMEQRLAGHESLLIAAPALVEAYAVLTRLPPPHRLSAEDTSAVLEANFLAQGKLIALEPKDYRALFQDAASHGVVGGRTYDWVIAVCARKAKAATLLTFNLRDFLSLSLEEVKLCEPGVET
jgi:predicted nucleic acid-binding protein